MPVAAIRRRRGLCLLASASMATSSALPDLSGEARATRSVSAFDNQNFDLMHKISDFSAERLGGDLRACSAGWLQGHLWG